MSLGKQFLKKLIQHLLTLGTSDSDSKTLKERVRLLNIFWIGGSLIYTVGALLSFYDGKMEVVQQWPIRMAFFILVYFLIRAKKIQFTIYLFVTFLFLNTFYSAMTTPHQGMFPLVTFVLLGVSYYLIDNKYWNYGFLIVTIIGYLIMRNHQIESQYPVFDISYIFSVTMVFVSLFFILVLYKSEQTKLTKELEIQNKQLLHTDNVKNNLLSILSHDLRSPLVSITSLLTLILEEDEIKDSELFEMFDSIKNRSDLTLHLMDQILNWANTQVAGFKINPDMITVKNIFTEELMILEGKIEAKEAKITNQIPDDVMVYADLQIFKTVIRNVISNALKYINAKDEIIFETEKTDSGLYVIFRDNGVGIEKQRLDRIFTKKMDAEPGTQNEMGTGLGLLICNDFIKMHRGRIEIESELGQGTIVKTFWPNKIV